MKAMIFIPLLFMLLGISSCDSSQYLIRPGKSIGFLKIGKDISTLDSKSYRANLESLGLLISVDSEKKISSISTTNPEYVLNGTVRVGLGVVELFNALGEPDFVDGIPYDVSNLNKNASGFFAYSQGVVFAIKDGRIVAIIVVPSLK